MPAHLPARRRLLAASAAALLPMQRALARTRHAGGDWLEMIRAHHAMIVLGLEGLLQGDDTPAAVRQRMARTLSYQLSAHSQAEENAIHPVLARNGLAGAAGWPQAGHAPPRALQALAQERGEEAAWQERLRALRAAVQHHTQQDEVGGAYPKLQQKLDASENAALAEAYQREFSSVRGRS